jgi:hypothetical protein
MIRRPYIGLSCLSLTAGLEAGRLFANILWFLLLLHRRPLRATSQRSHDDMTPTLSICSYILDDGLPRSKCYSSCSLCALRSLPSNASCGDCSPLTLYTAPLYKPETHATQAQRGSFFIIILHLGHYSPCGLASGERCKAKCDEQRDAEIVITLYIYLRAHRPYTSNKPVPHSKMPPPKEGGFLSKFSI